MSRVALTAVLVQRYSLRRDSDSNRSITKLLCVKSVVFFLFWQGIIISGLDFYGYIQRTVQWSNEEVSAGLQVAGVIGDVIAGSMPREFTPTSRLAGLHSLRGNGWCVSRVPVHRAFWCTHAPPLSSTPWRSICRRASLGLLLHRFLHRISSARVLRNCRRHAGAPACRCRPGDVRSARVPHSCAEAECCCSGHAGGRPRRADKAQGCYQPWGGRRR